MYSEKLKIVKQSLGNYYRSNDELLFHCPKCNHYKQKLSVNIEKNVFQCWVCDFRGNKIDVLIKDRDLREKWRSLTNQVDLTRFEDIFLDKKAEDKETRLELPEHFSTLSSKI